MEYICFLEMNQRPGIKFDLLELLALREKNHRQSDKNRSDLDMNPEIAHSCVRVASKSYTFKMV